MPQSAIYRRFASSVITPLCSVHDCLILLKFDFNRVLQCFAILLYRELELTGILYLIFAECKAHERTCLQVTKLRYHTFLFFFALFMSCDTIQPLRNSEKQGFFAGFAAGKDKRSGVHFILQNQFKGKSCTNELQITASASQLVTYMPFSVKGKDKVCYQQREIE